MKGDILQTAREVSHFLREAEIPAVVIGGVAVVLHGYVRTTDDVDILVPPPLKKAAEISAAHGFRFDPDKREFVRCRSNPPGIAGGSPPFHPEGN